MRRTAVHGISARRWFITLFGIATRNGIMLVTHIHHLINVEGVRNFREAVERGAHERLVPILMTAAAAGLALIPLAMRGGQTGSEIKRRWRPLLHQSTRVGQRPCSSVVGLCKSEQPKARAESRVCERIRTHSRADASPRRAAV